MRKNKLIDLLNKIPGNPDIVIWNGLVEDVVNIESVIQECKLYKLSFEGYSERLNLDRLKNSKEPRSQEETKRLYKNYSGSWELYNYYPPDDNDPCYKSKTVYALQPTFKGENHFDRLGTIKY